CRRGADRRVRRDRSGCVRGIAGRAHAGIARPSVATRHGACAVTTPNIAPQNVATQEVAGQDIVLSYANVRAEYDALRSSAIVVGRSHRGRIRFIGARAAEALTGLVTSDVVSLAPGHGQYAAALTSKGRIVADLRIYGLEGAYLVDTPARA